MTKIAPRPEETLYQTGVDRFRGGRGMKEREGKKVGRCEGEDAR